MKRGVDLLISLAGLLLLSPLLLFIALLTALLSGRPILFVQERIGLDGRAFRMFKFRSMTQGSSSGLPITGRGDPRLTRWGRFLRVTKLDELPQLVNVLRGEMSLVGPRPEVKRYVCRYSAEQKRVLTTRPGLTDPASIEFRLEEDLLGAADPSDRERFYMETILPRKLALNLEYLDRAHLGYDLVLMIRTLCVLVIPNR